MKTAERVGAELGVSDKTVKTDAKFAAVFDTIEANVGEQARGPVRQERNEQEGSC